jgi:cation diffusion facilitator CzcD-associated flavoprotein CzcO
VTGDSQLPVAVIGAGGSGLLTAAALRRAGVDFEVLEARDGVGGTWRYDPDGPGSAAYASLIANTSKLRMSIGRKSIPGRPWQYAAHAEMLAYLEQLADDEDLRPHMRFGWRVVDARREEDGWTLRSDSGEERRYRAVVCALGTNTRPRFGQLPGSYAGEQLHSSAYRRPERFAGKDVLVLGLATSGAEVVGDIAGIARSVTVSVRDSVWIVTRRVAGYPLDWMDTSVGGRLLPWSVRRRVLAAATAPTMRVLTKGGMPRPTRRIGDDLLAISDSFPRAVRAGLVQFRPAVQGAEGREVRFVDGTTAEVDAIVHATGYDPATDFLPEDARPAPERLHRLIAHNDAPGLFFAGLFEAQHALLPIAKDQAAWVADALSGRMVLPSRDLRARDAERFVERRRRDFGDRRPYIVDFARYQATLRRDRRRGARLAAGAVAPALAEQHR